MMRFAGIDIGAERHMVAVLDEQGEVLCRSSPFGEDASGYARLFELLGSSADCLVALEATGHYWRNLFVALIAKDYAVAVLNPLRTARFAEEDYGAPRPMRSMPLGSRASSSRNDRERRSYPIR
jgi:transposase